MAPCVLVAHAADPAPCRRTTFDVSSSLSFTIKAPAMPDLSTALIAMNGTANSSTWRVGRLEVLCPADGTYGTLPCHAWHGFVKKQMLAVIIFTGGGGLCP